MAEVRKAVLPVPPFQCDAPGKYTFLPYGRFGARYLVGDEAAYKRLKPLRLWTRFIACGLSLLFWNTVIGFVSQYITNGKIVQQAGPLLCPLALVIFYVASIQRITRALPIEEPRPNFVHAFRECAYRADTGLLWGIQIACMTAAYCFATLHNPPLDRPQMVLNLIYSGIFATIAVICGLMLAIGNRRAAVRR